MKSEDQEYETTQTHHNCAELVQYLPSTGWNLEDLCLLVISFMSKLSDKKRKSTRKGIKHIIMVTNVATAQAGRAEGSLWTTE